MIKNLSCAMASMVLLAVGARGGESDRRDRSQTARDLLNEVRSAYRALHAYSDSGEIQTELVRLPKGVGGGPGKQTAHSSLTFVRPNKIALSIGDATVLSDGKDLAMINHRLKKYLVMPAKGTIDLAMLSDDRMEDFIFGCEESSLLAICFALIFSESNTELEREFGMPMVEWALESDQVVDGKSCKCLSARWPRKGQRSPLLFGRMTAYEYRLLIEPSTKLLRKIELEIPIPRTVFSPIPEPPLVDAVPEGEKNAADPPIVVEDMEPGIISPYRWTWQAGRITTVVPDESTFHFSASNGYKRVQSFKDLLEKARADRPDALGQR